MNSSGDFLPCVMMAGPVELEMCNTMRYNLEVLAAEFAGEGEFLPEDPVLMLNMKG